MKKRQIDQASIKQYLNYDPETGIFTRRIAKSNRIKVGDIAGCMSDGYIKLTLNNVLYFAHRLAWIYVYGDDELIQIDHIDGNRSNNKITNLRRATTSENKQNQKKCHKSNPTGLLGVSFDKERGKFMAQIVLNYKHINLGRFTTKEEAHEKYLQAKRNLHPFNTL